MCCAAGFAVAASGGGCAAVVAAAVAAVVDFIDMNARLHENKSVEDESVVSAGTERHSPGRLVILMRGEGKESPTRAHQMWIETITI